MTASNGLDGRSRRASALREQRRALILDAAIEVFSHSGYHHTRIADIIEAAGIARGTFYLYFESKQAIFLELLDDLLVRLRSSVVPVETRTGAPPVLDQLLATVKSILHTVHSNRALTTIILREAVGFDEAADRRLERFYDNLHALVADGLRNGQRLGFIRPLDPDIVATCVLGSVKQILERDLARNPSDSFDIDAVARVILDYNAHGLVN